MLVAALALPMAVACGGDSEDSANTADAKSQATATSASNVAGSSPTTASAPARPPAVKDATGTTISLEKPAVRVVCLTGLCVDTLYVVGIKPVAALDALHKDKAYWGPSESQIGAVGGSFFEPSLEDIAKAKPDLIIGLGGVHDGLRSGLSNVAPLLIVNPIGVDGMTTEAVQIGSLLGKEAEVKAAADKFRKRMNDYAAKIKSKKDFLVVFGSDVNIGVDTLCTPAVDAMAHAANYGLDFPGCVHGDFPSFSVEELLSIDPDVIFVQTFGFGPTPPQPVSEQLANNVIWQQLSAVKNRQVYEVSFDVWGTSRGVRGATVALDEAMTKMYPDVFPVPLP